MATDVEASHAADMHLQQVDAKLLSRGPWAFTHGPRLGLEKCDFKPMISDQDPCVAQNPLVARQMPRNIDLGPSNADLGLCALRAPWTSDHM